MARLGPLVRLARPLNALVAGAGVLVGALLAGGPLGPTARVALGALAAVAFAGAGNVRNDLSDVEVDRRAHPARPLVTGEATPRAARALSVGFYALALACAALVSLPAFGLVLVAVPLMEGYERALKRRGLAGNVAIGLLAAAPFVLGALSVGARVGPAVASVALLAALATTGREVLKDVEDVDADRGHRATLPLRVGARRAALVAAAFLGAAVALSPLPWRLETVLAWPYVPAVALADAGFVAAAVLGFRRPSAGQRLAKLAMVAAMLALVVGRVAA